MQNCKICDIKLGNIVDVPYSTNEKVWLITTPCCNNSICLKCLLKFDKIQCRLCNEDIIDTLPMCIARLTCIKP